MAIEFRCTNCNKLLRTKDDTAGKQAKCPECGTILQIPAPGHVPPPPPGEFAPPPTTNYGTGQEYGATPSPAESSNPFAAPQFGGSMAAAPDSSGRTGPPWERDGQNVNSYIETVKQVFMDPLTTFANMRREGGFGKPLMYAIVGAFVGMVVSSIYNLLFPNPFIGFFVRLGGDARAFSQPAGAIGFICSIVVTPFAVAAVSFILTGIYHLMLMLVGGNQFGFETTYRVWCYGAGTTGLLQVIPFLGGIASFIAHIVYMVLGLMKAHEISAGKAVLAVLLPILLCCSAILLMWGALVAVLLSGAQRGAPF
jgi:phage FluMu protein Com